MSINKPRVFGVRSVPAAERFAGYHLLLTLSDLSPSVPPLTSNKLMSETAVHPLSLLEPLFWTQTCRHTSASITKQ